MQKKHVTPEWLDWMWTLGGPIGFIIGILALPFSWLSSKVKKKCRAGE